MKEHLRNVLTVDNDGLNHVITYEVKAMYDVVDDEGLSSLEHELLERFQITWDELDKSGRTMGSIKSELVQKHDIDTRW